MTAPHDLDRQLQAFLQDGPTELPDPSFDAVRDRTETTRQRVFVAPWRVPDMSKLVPIGLGAVAVIAVLFLGSRFIGSPSSDVGGPTNQPPASAAPTAAPASVAPTTSPEQSLPPASPPPLTQAFTSTQHGISLSYPQGWTARAAAEPWTDRPGVPPFIDPGFDVLHDPVQGDHLFLYISSYPIGDSAPEGWIAAQMANNGCTTTEPIEIDGARGLIGANDCDTVAVTTASRGYLIALGASNDDPVAVARYDRAWFEEVLATVQLHPEDAVVVAPSASS
jgi:hypothetical protein